MTRALKDMLQALADVGGVTSPYERTLMRPFALILTVVLLRGAVPQTAQMQTRLQSSDLLKLRSVTGCRALTRRRPRRLRRRQQRRTGPPVRSGLGDDTRRRQERALRR